MCALLLLLLWLWRSCWSFGRCVFTIIFAISPTCRPVFSWWCRHQYICFCWIAKIKWSIELRQDTPDLLDEVMWKQNVPVFFKRCAFDTIAAAWLQSNTAHMACRWRRVRHRELRVLVMCACVCLHRYRYRSAAQCPLTTGDSKSGGHYFSDIYISELCLDLIADQALSKLEGKWAGT